MADSSISVMLQGLLDRLRTGDDSARDELIGHASNRLLVLTRRMLRKKYDRLRAWEQTDDITQNAVIRLHRVLKDVHPATVREFMGLASEQIRRELIDLARHHFGRARKQSENDFTMEPLKAPAPRVFQQSTNLSSDSQGPGPLEPEDKSSDPEELAGWREFHEFVQGLPESEREIVEMLWYQGLTQEDAAAVLGVDKSTVKRRWRAIRLKLTKVLHGWMPDTEGSDDQFSE